MDGRQRLVNGEGWPREQAHLLAGYDRETPWLLQFPQAVEGFFRSRQALVLLPENGCHRLPGFVAVLHRASGGVEAFLLKGVQGIKLTDLRIVVQVIRE